MSRDSFLWKLRLIRNTAKRAFERRHGGVERPKTCNICGYAGFLLPYGWPVRLQARCPKCGSVERHRELKVWLDANPNIFERRNVLHFAPEQTIANLVRPLATEYKSADIAEGRADLKLNIEKLDLPDNGFDALICSHVLEHVDDRAALSEMYRILRPGGFAVLMTPVIEGWAKTYESASVLTEADRVLQFGQHDHLRYYGADIRDRIRAAGFALSEFTAEEPYVSRHALSRGSKIFIATRE